MHLGGKRKKIVNKIELKRKILVQHCLTSLRVHLSSHLKKSKKRKGGVSASEKEERVKEGCAKPEYREIIFRESDSFFRFGGKKKV